MRHKRQLELTVELEDGTETSFTVEAGMVDNGIGSYEYWGAKGVHHQWEIEWDVVKSNHPYIGSEAFWNDESLQERLDREVEEKYQAMEEGASDAEADAEVERRWEARKYGR